MFFDQAQWRAAVLVVQVVLTATRLCVSGAGREGGREGDMKDDRTIISCAAHLPQETNQSFRDYLLKGHSAVLKVTISSPLLVSTLAPYTLTVPLKQESLVADLLKMHR